MSLWNLITSGSTTPDKSRSSTSTLTNPSRTLGVATRQLSISDGCLLQKQIHFKGNPSRTTEDTAANKAGWVTKLTGGRLKSWRRRFMVLDRHGTVAVYQSEKDASQGRKATDIVPASNIRSVGRRERTDSGSWPHGANVDYCLQICVLKGKTHMIVCDSKAECVEWLRRLSPFVGNPRAEKGVGSSSGPSAVKGKPQCSGRRCSLDNAVRSPPKPTLTTWKTGSQWSSNLAAYGLHSESSIPLPDRECFLKWLKVAELTLRRFENICHLPAYSISLQCDIEQLYRSTPAADKARLGEYIFGDYPDELLHNLSPLLEHPVGRALLLSQMPSSKIIITYKQLQIRYEAPHSLTQEDGALQLAIDPRRLGKEMTSVGLSFLDDARVTRSQLIHSDHCGDIVFVSYLAAVDILNQEQSLIECYKKLKHCASWPKEDEINLKCLWYDMEAAVLSHPEGGFSKARNLGTVVIGGVVIPMLQQLTTICRSTATWQLGTSVYYKMSKQRIVVEISRSTSPGEAPIMFGDGCLYLRPTAAQLVENSFFHVIQSFDLSSVTSHSETIV